jgi:hypothetical protein
MRKSLPLVRGIIGALCCICLSFPVASAQEAEQAPFRPSPEESLHITPQNLEKLLIMQDSLFITADSMFNALIPDTHVEYSERFVRQLVHALRIPNSYYFRFDKLKDLINFVYADDSAFRIINWGIQPDISSERYYGAIQMPSEKLKLYGLTDYTNELGKGKTDSILTGGKWFGGIYYRVISHELDGKKIYTLFGFNGSSPVSNYKFLDPLTIDEKGITFGAPIFTVGSQTQPGKPVYRFVLEYKKGIQVTMNWDAERQAIVFDYLVSQINDPNRKYTYVPTGQYDGFRWGNGVWNYIRDLIPVTILQDGQAPDGVEK